MVLSVAEILTFLDGKNVSTAFIRQLWSKSNFAYTSEMFITADQ